MITKYIITIIAVLTTVNIFAQDILNNYLEIAARNNPGVKAKFNEYLATLETVSQVGTLPDPQLVFGYFIQPVETRVGPQEARVALTQMFPWFGTLNARENVAIQSAKAKYEAFEEAKSNLFLEVKSTYYDLYFIQQALAITSNNIKILNTLKNLALIKIEAGTASAVDQIRVEMELTELENNLALLKDKWNLFSIQFKNLLNLTEEIKIEIPETLRNNDLTASREALIDSLKRNNHQVLNLNYILESYKSKEQLAKKSGMPNISIGIDYIAIGKSTNPMVDPASNGQDAILFPNIGITLPLYRKKYSSMVKEAVFMQQATEEQRVDKINTLETLFEKAHNEYRDADRRIVLYQKQRQLAEKAIKILEAEYTTNGINFEEILRMEKRMLGYSLELEKARGDKQASIAFIKYLMGQ